MAKLKPELKVGDRIFLIRMEDLYPSVFPGQEGTVKKIVDLFGVRGYEVDWDNGSKLSLWSDVDSWILKPEKKSKDINEDKDPLGGYDYFLSERDIHKFYKVLFFVKYLKVLRQTGLVNMFGAAPYLYMGKERLKKELDYKEIEITEPIEELLELADESQSHMVNGAIKRLQKGKKEVTPETINRMIQKDSTKIVGLYISIH